MHAHHLASHAGCPRHAIINMFSEYRWRAFFLQRGSRMKRLVIFSGFMFLVAMIFGCSGNTPNPAAPAMSLAVAQSSCGRVLWGLWQVTIDPRAMTADIIPQRGEQFNANVTQFLQPPSSKTNMLSIAVQSGGSPSTGHFIVDVTVHHPFPGLNEYRGFDVRGILMADGSVHGNHDSGLIYSSSTETHLLNADGWTRWWNPSEFTTVNTLFGFTPGKLAPPVNPNATLNGYKYFADELTATADISSLNPANRGTFGVTPGVNTRRYDIQFKMQSGAPVMSFNYAVDASWNDPDPSFKPDYPLQAFSLSANCQEAYALSCGFSGSTAYYVDSTQNGGDIHASLEIADWQALKSGNKVANEVASIWVEAPSLSLSPINVLPTAVISGGNGSTSSVFTFDLHSVKPSGLTGQTLLVSVVASNPSDYAPQVTGGSSFAYPHQPLTAYRFFDVPILTGSPVTTPVVLSINPNYGGLESGNLPVLITGQFFANNATAQLVKSDNPAVILNGSTVNISPDGTKINCNFNMNSANGAQLGVYDVVVTNPGAPPKSGSLAKGFTIYPTSTCSEVYKDQLYNGDFANYIDYMNDLAFTKDGLLLHRVKVGSEYDIDGFDVTNNGTATGTPIIEDMVDGANSIFSIDVDDFTGNIIYVAGGYDIPADNRLQIYKRDGTYVGNIVNQNTDHLTCVDTDADGSIWTIGHTYENPSGGDYNIVKYFIDHYKYNSSTGAYTYDAAGSIDATSKLYTYYWPTIFRLRGQLYRSPNADFLLRPTPILWSG